MALWQREVIGEHVPERLLDLTHQQTGLAASLLEDDTSAGISPDATAVHVKDVARRRWPRFAHASAMTKWRWQWGRIHQAHWHHPVGDAHSTSVRARVDGGSHTLRNTGGEMPPHMQQAPAPNTASSWISPRPSRSWRCRTSAIPAFPAAAHYRDQFEPWLARRISRQFICGVTASKPSARARRSSSLPDRGNHGAITDCAAGRRPSHVPLFTSGRAARGAVSAYRVSRHPIRQCVRLPCHRQ